MGSIRVAFPDISSWTPAIEAKAVENGSLFVLDGKNFAFDSKGPGSFFGAAAITDLQINTSVYPVESINLASKSLVMTELGVFDRRWNESNDINFDTTFQQTWNQIYSFDPIESPAPQDDCWTSAYVGYTDYICHPKRGIFKVRDNTLDVYAGVGAPDDPICIIEDNGRLIILSRFMISWSAPFNGDDMSPSLGGGGFQVTAELVPGNPLALTPFEGGFIVWTDGGAVLAEYVGGDGVYRWDRIHTEMLLYSGSSWCNLSDGSSLIVTRQGLQSIGANGAMSEVAPMFNEYLRGVLQANQDIIVRPTYIQEEDRLYLQLMGGSHIYNKTLVLSVKLDKWGIFSEMHAGFVRISDDPFTYGYVANDGYVYQLTKGSYVEMPDGTQRALDSFITLGYLRPANEAADASVNFEVQEILATVVRKRTIAHNETIDFSGPHSFIDWNAGFFSNGEDYNLYGVNDYTLDFNLDSVISGTDEDYNELLDVDSTDHNDSVFGGPVEIDYNDFRLAEDFNETPENSPFNGTVEDWQNSGLEDEDWGGPQALLNEYAYTLKSICNLDGFEPDLEVTPYLALPKPDIDLWTTFTHGHNHRLVFSANQVGQKFHVRSLAISVHSAGKQA